MRNSHLFGASTWGFIVGFVGWTSCFRLVQPVAEWVLPLKRNAQFARVTTTLIVAVFLIWAVLLTVSLVPILIMVAGPIQPRPPDYWRELFGAAFMASLAGALTNGMLSRLSGTEG